MKNKKYKLLLFTLIFLSLFPAVALKIYIVATGDVAARWAVIKYMKPQLVIWCLLIVVLGYGWHKFDPDKPKNKIK